MGKSWSLKSIIDRGKFYGSKKNGGGNISTTIQQILN